ncbi:MAG: tetratricopeptide repeat protein [Aureliella sp.]
MMLRKSKHIVDLLCTAAVLAPKRSNLPMGRWPLVLITVCVVGGGCRLAPRQDVVRVNAGPETPLESLFSGDYERATNALRKGKTAKALSLLTSIAERNPSHGPALNNLGLIYYEKRQLPLAAAHFSRATELMPSNPTPMNNLGMAFEAGGKVEDALSCYEQAYVLAPGSPQYLGNLVRLKIRLGLVDDLVIAQLEELAFIEDRPDWIDWVDEQLAIHFNPALERSGDDDYGALGRAGDPESRAVRDNKSRIIDLGLEGNDRADVGQGPGSLESLPVPSPRLPRRELELEPGQF